MDIYSPVNKYPFYYYDNLVTNFKSLNTTDYQKCC